MIVYMVDKLIRKSERWRCFYNLIMIYFWLKCLVIFIIALLCYHKIVSVIKYRYWFKYYEKSMNLDSKFACIFISTIYKPTFTIETSIQNIYKISQNKHGHLDIISKANLIQRQFLNVKSILKLERPFSARRALFARAFITFVSLSLSWHRPAFWNRRPWKVHDYRDA